MYVMSAIDNNCFRTMAPSNENISIWCDQILGNYSQLIIEKIPQHKQVL